MAKRWAGTTNNFGTAGNWSGGVAPVNDDTLIISDTSIAITTGMDQSLITGLTIIIGSGFKGSLGTSSSPLLTGTGTTIVMASTQSKGVHITPAATSTKITVKQTPNIPHGFHLVGGTTTDVYIQGGRVTLGAAATITNLYIMGQLANVTLEDGLTLSTIVRFLNGYVTCEADLPATLVMKAGTWIQQGDGEHALPYVEMWGGAFYFNAPGGTITDAHVYSGYLDATDGAFKTITNLEVWAGGEANLLNGGSLVITNNPDRYGGIIHTDHAIDEVVPPDISPGGASGV